MDKPSLEDMILEKNRIKITHEALEKGNLISKRINELAGESLQAYLLLTTFETNYKRRDITIRDIYIGDDQQSSPDQCSISEEGKIKSEDSIRKLGQRIIGWGRTCGINSNYTELDYDHLKKILQEYGIPTNFNLLENHGEELNIDVKHIYSIIFDLPKETNYAIAFNYKIQNFDGTIIEPYETRIKIFERK